VICGTCSLCRGRVTLPDVWFGTEPPVPTCEKCHAVAKTDGPVIEMVRPRTASNVIVLEDGREFPVG
jgi:hypothetical protein